MESGAEREREGELDSTFDVLKVLRITEKITSVVLEIEMAVNKVFCISKTFRRSGNGLTKRVAESNALLTKAAQLISVAICQTSWPCPLLIAKQCLRTS